MKSSKRDFTNVRKELNKYKPVLFSFMTDKLNSFQLQYESDFEQLTVEIYNHKLNKSYKGSFQIKIVEGKKYFIVLSISEKNKIDLYIGWKNKLLKLIMRQQAKFSSIMKQISLCRLFCIGTSVKNFLPVIHKGEFDELFQFKNSFKGRMSKLFVFNKRLKQE